ncbi:hypothetical protein THMIRHAM_15970 [Thiomicrorhabdus immobilis]|uniref:HTH cro/C1-type domain-containing protein n=1 Tax=Thiomicrorhabdus immobilis TaxID=2791037 RepID=A0ABN6D0W3_9GAMM|nr:helix-turn-helix domain-containing protein [Thiomicrorhabdus immobilis]BCN93812.1 hypothetical protein THMIRHAM_15970 [Thiomicrorhabdus immobilis]
MTETVENIKPMLAELLYESRQAEGLSLEAAAEKLNLPVEQLTKFESQSLVLSELTTFERGYLRNYASLLNVDLDGYHGEFPDGKHVATNLQPIQRFSYKSTKPIMSRGWVKWMFLIVIFAIIVWLVSTIGIDFTQPDSGKMIEQATEMSLPTPGS